MFNLSTIKYRLWPVHRNEFSKVIPLVILKFCSAFIYTLLFVSKDTLIITNPELGAQAIPMIKGSVMLVAAIMLAVFYSKSLNYLSPDKIFYYFISGFMTFYILFAFYLAPNSDFLTLDSVYDFLIQNLGTSQKHWFSLIRHWHLTLYYIISELWASFAILTIFWGIANTINSIGEAKRFYSLFAAGGHLATTLSGVFVAVISQQFIDYNASLQVLMGLVFVFGLIMLLTFKYLYSKYQFQFVNTHKKPKLTFKEGITYLIKSKHLLCIATIVIAYSFTMNMTEVFWKDAVREYCKNSNYFQSIMGNVLGLIGLFSLICSLVISGNILHVYGWFKTAVFAPFSILSAAILFFIAYLTANNSWLQLPSSTLLYLAVILGAGHNILAKIVKYCFFDLTKEMTYIPLSKEEKSKGKAAIDVVASRFGKSGSSWIQIIAIELVGATAMAGIAGYMLPLILIVFYIWFKALRNLAPTMQDLAKTTAIEKSTPIKPLTNQIPTNSPLKVEHT